ncbi:MAG: amino acid permease [Hyphomonadaceae bacterium]|nr:amino acid permease [Hyphomonadaceae bacterium]
MSAADAAPPRKPLGFWACWSLTVGVMIGSGVFMLPAALAPYGVLSYGGWLISAAGAIVLALTVGRLAQRMPLSGGPYVYVRDAFGDLAGFMAGWGYWVSYWTAIPAIAIAFAAYAPSVAPAIGADARTQTTLALALIWTLTLIALRGVRETGAVQIIMTLAKLVPLLAIIALGAIAGDVRNAPALNPSGLPPLQVFAATALLTMWAFSGLEAGAAPASDVEAAHRTIPRAIVAGVVTVTILYLSASAAVAALVPPDALASSGAPFADAARAFGPWGPPMIAIGAMIAAAGALNGTIFVAGQLPMAVARDGLAPSILARRNAGGAPAFALVLSSALGSALLIANATRGLAAAFTFLLTMSTLTVLIPLLASAAAEMRRSWRTAPGWAAIALSAAAYCIFAILGAGAQALFWGLVLMALGAPLYFLACRKTRA